MRHGHLNQLALRHPIYPAIRSCAHGSVYPSKLAQAWFTFSIPLSFYRTRWPITKVSLIVALEAIVGSGRTSRHFATHVGRITHFRILRRGVHGSYGVCDLFAFFRNLLLSLARCYGAISFSCRTLVYYEQKRMTTQITHNLIVPSGNVFHACATRYTVFSKLT